MLREMSELAAMNTLGVKGRVEVEIIDDASGRVVSRQDAPNYVNTAEWERYARALQRHAWSYGYAGDASTVTNSPETNLDPRFPPTFRNDFVACWTDTTAEDSSDVFAMGEIIAWAHRWAQGSPSTRQGLVQPTLCTITEDAVSWVWEWATSNGNGTFQSVGWRRFGVSAVSGDAVLRDTPVIDGRLSATTGFVADAGVNNSAQLSWAGTGALSTYGSSIYYDSGSGKLYTVIGITGSLWKLYSCPVTFDAYGDYTLGTTVDESAAAFAAGLNGNSLGMATRTTNGITRLGASGDWIAVGYSGATNTNARRPTICRVTNAGATIYTNANGGTYAVESAFHDVTYDGTYLWVTAHNGSTGANAVHRIDPATGTISATISAVASVPAYFPAWSATGSNPIGIEWDAANSWLWVTTTDGYLYNIDTSGNWLGVLLNLTGNNQPFSGSLSGQHTGTSAVPQGPGRIDSAFLTIPPQSVLGSSTVSPYHQGDVMDDASTSYNTGAGLAPVFTASKMTSMDGFVWVNYGTQASSWTTGTPSTIGKYVLWRFSKQKHFATRTLLGSPAIKNNTQTMRIRYTMTFT